MYIKKVFVELKRRKQIENLAVFVESKRKNKITFNFLYAIKTQIFLVVIRDKIIHLDE
jgi:hypothetical protein